MLLKMIKIMNDLKKTITLFYNNLKLQKITFLYILIVFCNKEYYIKWIFVELVCIYNL